MTPFFRLTAALILLLTGAVAAQPVHNIWDPPYRQGIAAQVEDRIITFEELRLEMGPLVQQVRAESRSAQEFTMKMRELYREVLQNLIDRVLIVKDFESKEEWQLPSSVLENEYDRILIEDFGNDRARFHEHLKAQGKNVREFRRDLYERIIVSIMRSQNRRSQSYVSPERIERFYNENKIHFFQDESVHLRLIMLKPFADESPDLLRQNAEKVMAELDAGAPFEEIASEYSQDNRREKGGDWGWIKRTDLREELSEVAFGLEVGSYSRPVNLGDEIFILYVEDRREEGIQKLEDVRDRIEEILVGQISRQAQKQWLERLRKNAFVKYY